MNKELGTIEEIDLREIFMDEARDLTPWLAKAENLEALGKEIGIEMSLKQVEANVGRFNVDILAEEVSTGRKIVIENQLEMTDHDHLGKIITYAAGHEASVVIWIFKDIREEHREAIEWLNEHTNGDIGFFAIKLQLWKIDNSNPAVKFEMVVSPNEWTKTLRSKASGEISETKLQQLEFWTAFKDWMQKKDGKIKLQTPRPQHWFNISIGSSEANLSVSVNTRESLGTCEIYISRNKDLFRFLQKNKDKIEKEMKMSLDWIEAAVATRIKISKEGLDIQDAKSSEMFFGWYYTSLILFRDVFSRYIEEFKNL